MEPKKQAKKKSSTWVKKRHKIARDVLRPVVALYSQLRYNVKADPFLEQGNRPYLIMMNHQTPVDQFFIGMSFKGAVYYIATEDLSPKDLFPRSSAIWWHPCPSKSRRPICMPLKPA